MGFLNLGNRGMFSREKGLLTQIFFQQATEKHCLNYRCRQEMYSDCDEIDDSQRCFGVAPYDAVEFATTAWRGRICLGKPVDGNSADCG